MKRWFFIPGALLAAVVALAGCGTKTVTKTVTVAGTTTSGGKAVSPQVAAGAHDFVQFACAQCHGERGRGGVSPDVPALSSVARALTPAELRSIINHGLGESKNPTRPFMPVWGDVISKRQVSDLVAYLRAGSPAVATAEPVPIPQGQGPRGRGGGPVCPLRVHQLPRAERPWRRGESAVSGQGDPAAVGG
jgi:mono/diheme cytochrome c family protein